MDYALTVYWVVTGLLVADFILEQLLLILNRTSSSDGIPDLLKGMYDENKYATQQKYLRANSRIEQVSIVCEFLLYLSLFTFGGLAWMDTLARSITDNSFFVSLLFFLFFGMATVVVDLPFSIYRTFVTEQRFGFNKTTPWVFVTDTLKEWALGIIIGGVLISVMILVYSAMPDYFWLLAWGIVVFFSVIMAFFYSTLIVPLFNKQKPLLDGELKSAIESFSQRVGFKVNGIYVMDGSKRSTKANAYFTGFGKKKRIVLYDTLLEQLTIEETVAVLAHEIGHYKHRHIFIQSSLSMLANLLVFYLLGVCLQYDFIAQAVGCSSASFHINFMVFMMMYSPLNILTGMLENAVSRRCERQADAFVRQNNLGPQLISALKKISAQALDNLTPHPLFVFVNYTNPTLYQRVKALTD